MFPLISGLRAGFGLRGKCENELLAFLLNKPPPVWAKKAAGNVGEAVSIPSRFFSPKPQPGTAAASGQSVAARHEPSSYAPAKAALKSFGDS
jgi:hypothetical protein